MYLCLARTYKPKAHLRQSRESETKSPKRTESFSLWLKITALHQQPWRTFMTGFREVGKIQLSGSSLQVWSHQEVTRVEKGLKRLWDKSESIAKLNSWMVHWSQSKDGRVTSLMKMETWSMKRQEKAWDITCQPWLCGLTNTKDNDWRKTLNWKISKKLILKR